MTTSIQKEAVLDVADEVEKLIRLHYEESALHRDDVPLLPDWARYVAMEEHGMCHVFTARLDGKLIGYSVFFTFMHIHHSNTLVAVNDVIFVHKDHRKGTAAGIRLIDFCESQLKSIGVRKLTWNVKFEHDWSPVLHRRGYEDEEKAVSKIL